MQLNSVKKIALTAILVFSTAAAVYADVIDDIK